MALGSRKLTILYGSQTGTAQEVAERIWRESKRYHFSGPVKAMDDYNISQLISEQLVIFVCSTTGQGEEPDNMKKSWRFLLRRSLPSSSLVDMRFAVLGLGDSSYVKFNLTAKLLHRRLGQLGGQPLVDLGLADDQHDLGADGAIDPWISELWEKLALLYPLPAGVEPLDEKLLCLPRWKVSILLPTEGPPVTADVAKPGDWTLAHPTWVTVRTNTRITLPSHFQDVRLIELDAPGVTYTAGDVLMVRPHNLPDKVDSFLSLLSPMQRDMMISVTEREPDMPVPAALSRPITLQECAEHYWDLSAVPGRHFFHLLSHFTSSELERDKFIEFTTTEGQQDLFDYCNRPRRSVVEVLGDFPHTTPHIPLDYLFELLPPIRPRAFSLASSPQAHHGQLHLLVAVVKYRTKMASPRLGLCSNWLASLRPGDQLPVWLRRGSFRFPAVQDVPVIMVGPGTGVAPFRSYIQERVAQGTASSAVLTLFFGCRRQEADFHCVKEWRTLEAAGLLQLHCAFSRDQEHKVYVQHLIKEQATKLWDLIHRQNAAIFVAGSSKNMPTAVREAFVHVARTGGGLSEEMAEEFVRELEKGGRYQTETWG